MSNALFTNEVVDGEMIVPIDKKKTVGEIVPSEIIVYNSNFAGVNTVQILLNSSRSIQDFDKIKVIDGRISENEYPIKKFELVNYELGTIILTEQMAASLFDKLKSVLGR